MDYGIIDCHAHIFPPAATAAGFPDVATHLLHQQRSMHMHGNQPYRRLRDRAIVTDRPLWDPNDPSPAGRRDVNFRVGTHGRYEWTAGGEDQYVQFLAPWMEDLEMTADTLVSYMDYAGVATAVLQNEHIYGNLAGEFAAASAAHPGRFVGLAQVEEAFAYQDHELERLADEIGRLGMAGFYFTTTGMFRSGYKPMHSDPTYDPFWTLVEKGGLPVFWVQSANSPVGTYEDEMRHLARIVERFPAIRHLLVHGVPTSLYADENDRLKLPSIIETLLTQAPVSAEILYPIAWGGKQEYPYPRAHLHIRQLVERFGASRFLWGSDAPNVDRYCTYAQSLTYFTRYCDYLSEADKRAILRDNAVALLPALQIQDGTTG
ncbi:amidohydrolase family protein [Mesorhizobium australicum]|uniref:Predicted metal-dependent hydrolase, TIM-barrel fold n=1 Tax=Mesorhizobium australicum TaxID=536018 RepID=A0A1X7MUV4_9HYPH|nr:amidohydrolase family protein [Mesorhizobium australicum]SMH28121.1 Predicted metal-dependent hydrolase, TIM-barrel fold [Mesorhizobium australicum]